MDDIQRALEEPGRLAALRELGLLDAPEEATLERYVRLLQNALGAPVALVSLVDDHRQFFTNRLGLPEPWKTSRETPLTHSFCKHVVAERSELIVENAPEHPVVRDNLAIRDLGVKAYAGVPIRTEDGHVLGSFCAIDSEPRVWTQRELSILRDLAESVSAEMDLRRKVKRAEASEQALARVNEALGAESDHLHQETRAALHDVRTPLSVLALGVSHLVSHDAARTYPEIAKLLGMLKRNVSHATSLVSTMHDITRLAAEEDDAGVVDVTRMMAEVAEDHGGGEIRVETKSSSATPVMVRIDATALRRAMENLVSNALRFAERRIVVGVTVDDGEVEIAVEDDGAGLPDAAAYRDVWLANKRFHEDSGRSGTGLGLSIVREVLQRFGGHVRARPSSLGGAKFILYLPVAEASAQPSSAS